MLRKVIIAAIICPQLAYASPYSLDECYRLTIQNSENLKIRDEEFKIAEANYKEALSGLYPQIFFELGHTIRDNSNFGRVEKGRVTIDDPSTPIGGSGGILGRTQTAGVFALTQPVFSGFREYLLSEAAKKDSDAIELQNKRAKELLFLDVADLYYQIIYTQEDLEVLEQSKKTLLQRVKDLQEFIKLGKSRESEVLAANSDIAELDSSRVQSTSLLKVSKELLAFLTGVPAAALILKQPKKHERLEDLDYYLAIARERSDLKAGKVLIESEELKLKAAHRERWPQIDLNANGYVIDDPARNREWDVFLLMSIPVFDWGKIESRTEEGEARVRSANLQNAEALRLTERDVRVAFVNVASIQEQIESLKKLKFAASKNYELQKQDYSNGVVNNLEVLQAIRQVQDTERRLINAEQRYKSNLTALKVATGGFAE